MDSEQLIWRFLDGELSAEEDARLRELLACDPAARALFEMLLTLYLGLRADAESIEVPNELRSWTQTRVRARMQQHRALSHRQTVARFLVFAGFWLLALVISFGDALLREERVAEASGGPVQGVFAAGHVQEFHRATMRRYARPLLPPRSERKRVPGGSGEPSAPSTESAVALTAPAAVNARSATSPPASSSQVDAEGQELRHGQQSGVAPSPASFDVPDGMSSTPVFLASFVAIPLLQAAQGGGLVLSGVLVYELNPGECVGIEIGSWHGRQPESAPSATASNPAEKAHRGAAGTGAESIPPPTEGSTGADVLPALGRYAPSSSWWGALFYERRLWSMSPVELSGRLGCGLLADNLLTVGGLYLGYTVSRSLQLRCGIDGRWSLLGKTSAPAPWLSLGIGVGAKF
ncbi:hypothetical protein HRbin21_01143 [bacterium HR21]|nr:hypothetical protein HRbin21_01143 [bacterium HR21]